MIKRTLYFGNPAYLSVRNCQLCIRKPEEGTETTIPIEDIGVVVLDHPQITLTHSVTEALLEVNAALITCDKKHLPVGLLLPLCGNTTQTERMREQLNASQPLKKQLWQQTVSAKINNQACLLEKRGVIAKNMRVWAKNVKSGDAENLEGRAAAYYWKNAFPSLPDFTREREEIFPNSVLNYGYALLRGIAARALVSSGLLPTFGIFHRNKYNAYCLADDVMEPYRPYIDALVMQLYEEGLCGEEIDKATKIKLLQIPVLDVEINGKRSPLMVAMTTTTASLQKCYAGEARRIIYPEMR